MKELELSCELRCTDKIKIKEDMGGIRISVTEEKKTTTVLISDDNAILIMRFIESTMNP